MAACSIASTRCCPCCRSPCCCSARERDMQKRLTLLGSTGSIGDSTLDVVARHPDRFSVYALTAHRNGDKLVEQCLRFQPEVAVVGDAATAQQVEGKLRAAGCKTEVLH